MNKNTNKLNERHNNIVFLHKIVKQIKDDSIPYSYKRFLYFFLVRPNTYFMAVCLNIGITPSVWNERYQELFSDMFV